LRKANPGTPAAVVLVGYMGAGKTSVGQELAQRLHWKFVDLDDVISARTGRRIAEIFEQSGETEFRRLETEALGAVLGGLKSPTVLSIGAGAFVQSENRRLLRSAAGRIVFLNGSPETLMERCRQHGARRPMFQDENQFRQLYESRRNSYMKADLCIDTTRLTIGEVAVEVARRLGLVPRSNIAKDFPNEV